MTHKIKHSPQSKREKPMSSSSSGSSSFSSTLAAAAAPSVAAAAPAPAPAAGAAPTVPAEERRSLKNSKKRNEERNMNRSTTKRERGNKVQVKVVDKKREKKMKGIRSVPNVCFAKSACEEYRHEWLNSGTGSLDEFRDVLRSDLQLFVMENECCIGTE